MASLSESALRHQKNRAKKPPRAPVIVPTFSAATGITKASSLPILLPPQRTGPITEDQRQKVIKAANKEQYFVTEKGNEMQIPKLHKWIEYRQKRIELFAGTNLPLEALLRIHIDLFNLELEARESAVELYDPCELYARLCVIREIKFALDQSMQGGQALYCELSAQLEALKEEEERNEEYYEEHFGGLMSDKEVELYGRWSRRINYGALYERSEGSEESEMDEDW